MQRFLRTLTELMIIKGVRPVASVVRNATRRSRSAKIVLSVALNVVATTYNSLILLQKMETIAV